MLKYTLLSFLKLKLMKDKEIIIKNCKLQDIVKQFKSENTLSKYVIESLIDKIRSDSKQINKLKLKLWKKIM